MRETLKLNPRLHIILALPGEKFEGWGASVSLDDVLWSLRKDVRLRVDPKIMKRANRVLWCMERILAERGGLTNEKAERAFVEARRDVLAHAVSGGHPK